MQMCTVDKDRRFMTTDRSAVLRDGAPRHKFKDRPLDTMTD